MTNLILEHLAHEVSKQLPTQARMSRADILNRLWISGKKQVWRMLYATRFNIVLKEPNGEIHFL